MRRAFPSVLAVLSLTGPRDCRFAILINTVAVYAYLNNCFPTRQGEVSALVNLARTLGGFACVALLPPTFPSSSLTVLYVAPAQDSLLPEPLERVALWRAYESFRN